MTLLPEQLRWWAPLALTLTLACGDGEATADASGEGASSPGGSGEVVVTDFSTLVDTWTTEYGAEAHLYQP